MNKSAIPSPKILAELLQIQRWAGGDGIKSARIFGLMHGIESVIKEENESFGISEETQRKVEEMLDDIDKGIQSTNGMDIKSRLHINHVKECDAKTIMKLCLLQNRFGPEIDKLINGQGSPFHSLNRSHLPEQDWWGALHYMELVDCTTDARKKLHPVFAATVPRVGEVVEPEAGSRMRVVEVEYHIVNVNDQLPSSFKHHYLVPYVLLEAIGDDGHDTGTGT
jgi:hypothetical protein